MSCKQFYSMKNREIMRALICSVNKYRRLDILPLKSLIRQVNCKDAYVTYLSSDTV